MTTSQCIDETTTQTGSADLTVISQRLLDWYQRHQRDLPWRRLQDPYVIWVAEIMLQQTRVRTVITYYERFLSRLFNGLI